MPDEVESLTAARAGAMAGTEPSDALRVRCSTTVCGCILILGCTGSERAVDTTRQAEAQEELFGHGNE